jgi:predicted aspartyl protease
MAITSIPTTKGWREREVGHVYAKITIENAFDRQLARNGKLPATEVRTANLEDVLIDTGASHLCLPADIVAALGLEEAETILVETAGGDREYRYTEGARVTVGARSDIFSCIEVPAGAKPLLGVIVMETLGLQPDIRRHELTFLPMGGSNSYIRA